MVQRVEHADIIDMLARRAEDCGLDLARFYELGRNDELDDPELRDLWLIWGDVITEADLRTPTHR